MRGIKILTDARSWNIYLSVRGNHRSWYSVEQKLQAWPKHSQNLWRWAYLNHFSEQTSWSLLQLFMLLLLSWWKKILSSQHVQGVCSAGNKSDLCVSSSLPLVSDVCSLKPFSHLPLWDCSLHVSPVGFEHWALCCPTQWRNGDSHRCFSAHMGIFNISDNF